MRLKDFLRVLILCGEILMPFTAFADTHDYSIMQEQKLENYQRFGRSTNYLSPKQMTGR